MAWEDGNAESVRELIEAAESTKSKETARQFLKQALSSAECIKDNDYQKKNLIALINDKLKDL